MPLGAPSHNKLRFIAEYLAMLPRDQTAAYKRVFNCEHATANANSSKMMADPWVREEIDKRERMLRADLELEARDVLREVALVATADPRELSEYHIGACRYCHGDGHRYQRTPAEFDVALRKHIDKRLRDRKLGPDPLGLDFDMEGGVGFNPYRAPHADCPECFGHGTGYEVFKDTRNLSPGAARLFDGVKRTKDGLEIKTRDRSKALDLAAQHLGLARKTVELSGRNGGPIQSAQSVSLAGVDPVTAAKLYQELVGGG